MTKFKKILVIGLAILSISAVSVSAVAATQNKNPAEVFSSVTGTSLEETTTLREQTGKTYGKLAQEAGKTLEFKSEMLEMKKDILATKVENKELTQQEADEILAVLEARMADCDQTGSQGAKGGLGLGLGAMKRQNEQAMGRGNGQMQRADGQRQNLRNGSCKGN